MSVQRVGEFRRPANPREGEHPRARDARRDGGVGREPRGESGPGQRFAQSPALADHDNEVGRRQLRRQRRAQRPGGRAKAIASAVIRVDDENGEVRVEAPAMQPVVQNQHAGAERLREARRRRAVGADDGWRHARQQQGFVSDIARVVAGRIDDERGGAPVPAAMAARQKKGALAPFQQHRAERQRRRGLAVSTQRHPANRDGRNIRARGGADEARARRRAIKRPKGSEGPRDRAGGRSPKIRRAHVRDQALIDVRRPYEPDRVRWPT